MAQQTIIALRNKIIDFIIIKRFSVRKIFMTRPEAWLRLVNCKNIMRG